MKNKGESKVLRLPLDDEVLAERFKVVKEHTGMQANRSVLGFLISQAYDRIQDCKYRRLFVTHETYDMAEKAAAARGETIDLYVQELLDDEIRKLEELKKNEKAYT